MTYPLVLNLAADKIPVAVTCRVLGFSTQGFYKWRANPVADRDWADAHLVNAAIEIHHDDVENWTDVYSTTTGAGGTETVTIREDTRYVRMQGVAPKTTYGYSLYEFEVYGTPVAPDVNLALNRPPSAYTASSQSNDGSGEQNSQPQYDRSAFRAFDGNPATRWGSNEGDDNWLQVDLGETYLLDRFVLLWEAAYSSKYAIQVSEDGSQWTDVHTHDDSSPTGDHPDEIVLEAPVEGRYVRMQGTQAATQSGLSLYEFEVYGTEKPADTAPAWSGSAQLEVSALTAESATLQWPEAADNQAVTGYKVYQGTTLKDTLAADARSYGVTGLVAGKTYSVKVTALDENGNESAALTKTFTTPGNPATTALSTTYPQTYDDWEEGLLAGDGKQGIMVFGNPRAETVVFDDRDFFMARKEDRAHRTFNTVSEENIKKIRDLLIGGAYQEANQLAADVQGWQDGGEGSKHPGFKMTIDIPDSGEISNYVRSTDYASGVVSVDWADDKGEWERESFVSSTDGATVQYLPAPAGQTLDATFGLSIDPGMNLLNKGLTAVNNSNTDYLNLRVKYPNGSFDAGYEGVTRIVTDGVKTMDGTDVSVTGATYVLLVSLTQRYDGTYEGGNPAEQEWDKELLQAKLAAMPDDYETLRDRHVSKHSEIFNRVSIDFAASDEDRSKSNEQLLAEQKASMTPIPALFERMFYSGRYHLLASSSATAPPDLLGNWTGDSNVGWDGYYHLDANLNLQISSGNIGNMPEVMEGYFNLNKEWQEDFRTNARKLLGTRGMLTGGNTPNGEGLISNINFDYPYQYVTGGESWLLYPFWEQYMVTGDKTFLEEEYYPLIRDMGDFYEDFLVEKDENGDYIFAGSISPENRPAGGVPLSVNSVYDIAGARFALSTLIETSEVLGKDQDKIAVWQELLDNLPPYLINNDGAIAELAWPDLANKNAYQHRHSSALMPVWPYREVTPEKDQALYDAAKVFLQKKDEGNYENAGHGLAHAALIAANLNNAPSVNAKLLRFAKDDYYYSSLATSHYNNHGVFATDVVNSVPTIMMEMLATTDPGTLELLPALPEAMKQGSISGMLGKSQFTIDNLDWDMDARKVSVTVTSQIDQDLTLIQREGIETISSDDIAIESSPLGDIARVLPLQKDETVTIKLTLTDASRVNLALDRPAVASSESNAQQTAAKAFDGDPTTSWGASESADNWLQVDLGEVYDLNEVVLQWSASYAKGYKLQASMDGVSWKDIYTQSDSSGGRESIPVDALGRYVRMQGTEKSGELGYSLYEMEVYGQEAPNIALGKPATASSESNAQQKAAAAFDGEMSTRWGADQPADSWLQVDLGDTYDVFKVAIEWEASYAKGYKLQTSSDGETWTDAFTETASDGGSDVVNLDVDTRYIRMQGTEKSGEWGYSIYEMKVYGQLVDDQAAADVEVSPAEAAVMTGGTQQFTAEVVAVGGADTSVTWSLEGAVSAGTSLSGEGLLTVAADETATALTVVATSVFDATRSGSAAVTVTIAPAVESVQVSPGEATLMPGGTQQFTAEVVAVGGADTSVTWSLEGAVSAGTSLSAEGLLTVAADETATALTVVATSAFDATRSGSALVTVDTRPVEPGTLAVKLKAKAMPASALTGTSVKLEVTVEPAKEVDGDALPSGSVIAVLAGVVYEATLDGGTVSLALPTSGLVGAYTVEVRYSGDSTYAAGTTTVRVNIRAAKGNAPLFK